MKRFLSIALCVVFTCGALVLWNWAEIWAEATDTNPQLFDAFAAFSLFAALACSCWFVDEKKKRNGKA